MSILIKNIKALLQVREPKVSKVSGDEMKSLPQIENAYLIIEHDTIVEFGKMEDLVSITSEEVIDATGKMVFPAWCDSHTYIVYAGDRSQEFVEVRNRINREESEEEKGKIVGTVGAWNTRREREG